MFYLSMKMLNSSYYINLVKRYAQVMAFAWVAVSNHKIQEVCLPLQSNLYLMKT